MVLSIDLDGCPIKITFLNAHQKVPVGAINIDNQTTYIIQRNKTQITRLNFESLILKIFQFFFFFSFLRSCFPVLSFLSRRSSGTSEILIQYLDAHFRETSRKHVKIKQSPNFPTFSLYPNTA